MQRDKKSIIVFLAGALLVISVFVVIRMPKAAEYDRTRAFVSKNDIIDGDYLGAGSTVNVVGTVNGDVMIAGGSVNFSGKTSQDILAAGGNVRIGGETGGNVRAVGGNIILENKIAKNATIAGGNILVDYTATIDGNLYVAGASAEVDGNVKGNAHVAGSQVVVGGNFARDVVIAGDDITILSGTKISGNLTYYSDNEISIDKSVVAGKIKKEAFSRSKAQSDETRSYLLSRIYDFLSFLILAFVFYRLFLNNAREIFENLTERDPWKNMAFGIITAILIPVAFILLIVSVIGIPLALVLLFGFILSIAVSKIIASMMLGYYINKRFKPHEFTDKFPLANFFLGFLVMDVLWLLPIFGHLIVFLIIFWAFGGLAGCLKNKLEKRRL